MIQILENSVTVRAIFIMLCHVQDFLEIKMIGTCSRFTTYGDSLLQQWVKTGHPT